MAKKKQITKVRVNFFDPSINKRRIGILDVTTDTVTDSSGKVGRTKDLLNNNGLALPITNTKEIDE